MLQRELQIPESRLLRHSLHPGLSLSFLPPLGLYWPAKEERRENKKSSPVNIIPGSGSTLVR